MRFFYSIAMLMTMTLASDAGWFGPSDYTECMIDGMKGQPSSMKSTVDKMCEAKFPCVSPEHLAELNEKRKRCVEDGRTFVDDPTTQAVFILSCARTAKAEFCPLRSER